MLSSFHLLFFNSLPVSPLLFFFLFFTACLLKLSLHLTFTTSFTQSLFLSSFLSCHSPSSLPLLSSLSLYLCLVVKWWLTGGVQPRIGPTRACTHTHQLISQEHSMQATCCTYCTHKDTVDGEVYGRPVRQTNSHILKYTQCSVGQVKSSKQSVESLCWSRNISWNCQYSHTQCLIWHPVMISRLSMYFPLDNQVFHCVVLCSTELDWSYKNIK